MNETNKQKSLINQSRKMGYFLISTINQYIGLCQHLGVLFLFRIEHYERDVGASSSRNYFPSGRTYLNIVE